MKQGPAVDPPALRFPAEFVRNVCALSFSASSSGGNRGTLPQVLDGRRCSGRFDQNLQRSGRCAAPHASPVAAGASEPPDATTRRIAGLFWNAFHYERCPWRAASALPSLRTHVPLRTWSEWAEARPGALQGDLVLHCGETLDGLSHEPGRRRRGHGLDGTEAIWVRHHHAWGAIEHIRRRLPMPLREWHNDNGGEFLNPGLVAYCRQHDIRFTRGRGYRKNDQAWVDCATGSRPSARRPRSVQLSRGLRPPAAPLRPAPRPAQFLSPLPQIAEAARG